MQNLHKNTIKYWKSKQISLIMYHKERSSPLYKTRQIAVHTKEAANERADTDAGHNVHGDAGLS